MDVPLLRPITRKFVDRSTAEAFAFSFFCDQCGKEWRSAPQVYEPSGQKPQADIRVLHMLRSEQHKAAYEQANLEALYVFLYCKECGRRVCMDCYSLCETDVADICKLCLLKQQNKEENP